MTFPLAYFTVLFFLGGLVALASGVVVILNAKEKRKHLPWLLLNISSAIWSFGYFSMITADTQEAALLSNWILHFGAIAIPFFYLLFIILMTDNTRRLLPILFGVLPFTLYFAVANMSTEMSTVLPKFIFHFAPEAGGLYPLFTIYFFGVNTLAGMILFFSVLESPKGSIRKQKLAILLASLAGFIGGGSVFFLTFNINLPPYPIIFFTLYPLIIVYSIARLNLFNVQFLATQTFVALLVLLSLGRLVLGESDTRMIEAASLVAIIVVGYLLIVAVNKEIRSRGEISQLAKRLTETNWELAKKNEELRVMDQRKSEFVSIVSHQLRTPITAIKGYSSMLLEDAYGPLSTRQHTQIEKIFLSSKRLADMVNDFLDISKIEQGTMRYEFSVVDIRKMLTEIFEEFMPIADKKGLTLDLTLCDERIVVDADEGKLRQIFSNLIDNAIKYTPQGSIMISLDDDKENERVICHIKDTGIGLSQDDIHQLFTKFARGTQGQRENTEGSGLGLYVAKRLLQAMGGDIWVDSDGPGKGCLFTVAIFYGEKRDGLASSSSNVSIS